MSFLVRILVYLEQHPEKDHSVVLSPAWLARAATNWIKNGLRDQWRQQKRELPLPSGSAEESEGDATPFPELISNEPSPLQETVRADFHQRLYNAIADTHLIASQRALLEPLLADESAADIARRTGRDESAIRHGLATLKACLRASLRAHDIGDAEVAAFLDDF